MHGKNSDGSTRSRGGRPLVIRGLLGAGLPLLLLLGAAGAADVDVQQLEARLQRLEQQNQELAAQNQRLFEVLNAQPPVQLPGPFGIAPPGPGGIAAPTEQPVFPPPGTQFAQPLPLPDALQQTDQEQAAQQQAEQERQDIEAIVADYLKAHPGAGVPYGVQTGYSLGQGFVIRSTPNPKWDNWTDDMKNPPFELRIRGRLQIDYYNFHPVNDVNYQTGVPFAASGGLSRRSNLNILEVKRARLIFEGLAFDPNLKYRVQLNGDTRGLGGLFNNNDISSGSPVVNGGSSIGGGGVTTDHAIRLYEAWVAYDFHPDITYSCNPNYRATLTAIAGKVKPFTGLEEFLGSGTDQFVDFSMADWFFSPDDDNLLMGAGGLLKAYDDRLYFMALMTNGSESNFAASQLDDYLGFNGGLWYDFGGTYDEARKAWQLYGDSTSDIDYSPCPVVRVGAGANIAPMDRRKLYGDAEQSRFRAAVGGARIIDILNGGGLPGTGLNSVDRFDAYTFNAYIAGKWRGWSIDNEWWVRYLSNFETLPNGNNVIFYNTFVNGTAQTALFPVNNLTDFGMLLQTGYFVIPTKLEFVGRWSLVSGESGNINGNGTSQEINVNGNNVRLVNGAFRQFHMADEYTIGMNVFFRKHLLKWQTDVGYYTGGNPANASAAGFITNADGFLVRTQVQVAF